MSKNLSRTMVVVPWWTIPCICLFLAMITWAVFGQTLKYDFVNYDDNSYVYENDEIKGGLTVHGIAWAFTHIHSGNWHPLTSIAHMVDCQLFGLKPSGHHFTNVALHTTSVILLFLVLRRMTGSLWRSAFVAAIFAVHPLRAESVAWVSERKDVLSGVFFMLTLAAYIHYARRSLSLFRYLLVFFLFALGLMAKPMLVTLPLLLLLVDFWPLRRFEQIPSRQDGATWWHRLSVRQRFVIEKIPLLVLSALSSVATIAAQKQALHSSEGWPLSWRINNAFVSFFTYVRQMVWPVHLAVFYPHPKGELSLGVVALAVATLVAISVVAFMLRRKSPYILVGWGWFLVMLLPVIGVIQVGWQGHADRYTYLPHIGLYLLVTWTVSDWSASRPKRRAVVGTMAAVAIVFLAWLAWLQASYWRDSESLWTHALAVTSGNDVAHSGLGVVLLRRGEVDAAIAHDREALALRPGNADARANLANALLKKGLTEEAIAQYQEALKVLPNESILHGNLGNAFLQAGQAAQAVEQYREFLKSQPGHPEIRYSLAVALLRQEETDEAIAQFREAVKLKPDYGEAYNDLAIALLKKGAMADAIATWEKALSLQPDNAEVHNNLAVALIQKGEVREAIVHWKKTLQLQPDKTGTLLTLAWVLATSPDADVRDGAMAIALARHAHELLGDKNLMLFRVVAAAYSEAGRFSEAVAAIQRGTQLATEQNQSDFVDLFQADLALYQINLPLRDTRSAETQSVP